MTRISQNQIVRSVINDALRNRSEYDRYAQELSTGLKVQQPGDSDRSATISQYQNTLVKVEDFIARAQSVTSFLAFQDAAVSQMNDLLVRAKEIGTQASSESQSAETRAQLAAEVYEIRENVWQLANSKYQGKYVFVASGMSDVEPFPKTNGFFTEPATAPADAPSRVFYQYPDTSLAVNARYSAASVRNVEVTDNLAINVSFAGDQIFQRSINGLTKLARSLEGYETEPDLDPETMTSTTATLPTSGAGVAYSFPTDFQNQTTDIKAAMQTLDFAREGDIQPARTALAGRMRRIETAENLLKMSKESAVDVLSTIRDADVTEAASNFSLAQTALEASLSVSARVLNQSILDFL